MCNDMPMCNGSESEKLRSYGEKDELGEFKIPMKSQTTSSRLEFSHMPESNATTLSVCQNKLIH